MSLFVMKTARTLIWPINNAVRSNYPTIFHSPPPPSLHTFLFYIFFKYKAYYKGSINGTQGTWIAVRAIQPTTTTTGIASMGLTIMPHWGPMGRGHVALLSSRFTHAIFIYVLYTCSCVLPVFILAEYPRVTLFWDPPPGSEASIPPPCVNGTNWQSHCNKKY